METGRDASHRRELAESLCRELKACAEDVGMLRDDAGYAANPGVAYAYACCVGLSHLQMDDARALERQQLQIALIDAKALRRALVDAQGRLPPADDSSAPIRLLVERLVTDLASAKLGSSSREFRTDSTAGGVTHSAALYKTDAEWHRRSSTALVLLAIVFVAAALALGVLGIRAAGGEAFSFAEFGAYGLVAAGLLVVAGVIARAAARAALNAREATRLARQLTLLDSYLEPLPKAQADLARSVMIPQMFPRLLEDDDPLRAPDWPDPAAIMDAAKPQQSSESQSEIGSEPAS